MTDLTLQSAYANKTVLVTGHTGFKGAWLSEWLLMLGARVVGIALEPDTEPALFNQLGLASRLTHHVQDIRDREGLIDRVMAAEPDFVFHLAAQPLVLTSYEQPVATWEINVMGLVNLLEALRRLQRTCATVIVTSDKCYDNQGKETGYRETDPLGGYDPYSASKAAAELVSASYRQSFFNPAAAGSPVGIATARAGNVIGGGDWARDRIVPDCIRHLRDDESIRVRNPAATRPWQHVLEPLGGYLLLAARQKQALETGDRDSLAGMCDAFNFGPAAATGAGVGELVEMILQHWPGRWHAESDGPAPHEAATLALNWDRAAERLNWHPVWDLDETVARTVRWYRQQLEAPSRAQSLVAADIEAYMNDCDQWT